MNNSIYISGNDLQYKTINKYNKTITLYKTILIISIALFLLGLICALGLYLGERNELVNMVTTIIDEQGQEVTIFVHAGKSFEELNELIFKQINMLFFIFSIVIGVLSYVSSIVFTILLSLKIYQTDEMTKKIID